MANNDKDGMTIVTLLHGNDHLLCRQFQKARFDQRVQRLEGNTPLFRIDVRDFNTFGKIPAQAYATADDVLLQGGYVVVDLPQDINAQALNTLQNRLMATAYNHDPKASTPVGQVILNPSQPGGPR